jgi:hypothetical protein
LRRKCDETKGIADRGLRLDTAWNPQTVTRDAAGNVATGATRLTAKLVKPKK